MYKLSKYHEIEKINDTESLIFSTRTAELMLISNEIYQKILISDYENIDEQVMYALFSAELLVPFSEDEYETIINNFKDNKDKKQETLSFTVQPTAICQPNWGQSLRLCKEFFCRLFVLRLSLFVQGNYLVMVAANG